jgi:hypothetical protein
MTAAQDEFNGAVADARKVRQAIDRKGRKWTAEDQRVNRRAQQRISRARHLVAAEELAEYLKKREEAIAAGTIVTAISDDDWENGVDMERGRIIPVNNGFAFVPWCGWNDDYNIYSTATEAEKEMNEWCDGCVSDNIGDGCWKGEAVELHVDAVCNDREILDDVPRCLRECVKEALRLQAIDEADW